MTWIREATEAEGEGSTGDGKRQKVCVCVCVCIGGQLDNWPESGGKAYNCFFWFVFLQWVNVPESEVEIEVETEIKEKNKKKKENQLENVKEYRKKAVLMVHAFGCCTMVCIYVRII